jgi:hypothetical protein
MRLLLKLPRLILVPALITGLIACGGGGGGFSSGPVFDPDVPPRNVQVVAASGDGIGPQNTVSWNPVTAATDYVVYWDNAPGVSESSDVLVPVPESSTELTHVGLNAGQSYYYRVEARSGSQVSVLSDEVIGIPQSTITTQNLLDIAWNGADTLVAVGNSGVITNSPNGTTDGWEFAAVNPILGQPETLAGITWNDDDDQFLAVGGGGTVLTSDDGDTWVTQNSQVNIDLEAVTWTGSQFMTGGRYVAVGGSATILTSPDGMIWTRRAVPPLVTGSLRGVTANDSLIVAVGNNGAILTSLTGETWTARASGVTSSLQDAVWDGSRFIVVGSGDIILTSTDGVAWQPGDPGSSGVSYFGAAHWASALLPASLRVAGGSSGTIVTSIDASDWLPLPSGTSRQLNDITWLDDQMRTHFVMVGNEGTVLTNIR